MKHVLEPLARLPGVRTAALVTTDGVPITVHGRGAEGNDQDGHAGEQDALAALAASWVCEVNRTVAPLSWDAPRHLVMRALRGTLVAMQAPGALMVVVLDSGASVEELRLPMEAAVGRMQRHLRQSGSRGSTANAEEPAAPLPSRQGVRGADRVPASGSGQGMAITGNGVPEAAGE